MLYVKHVERSGHEGIRYGTSMHYRPATRDECQEVILYGDPDPVSDGCTRFASGILYVMNDHGATIAKFDLGETHG